MKIFLVRNLAHLAPVMKKLCHKQLKKQENIQGLLQLGVYNAVLQELAALLLQLQEVGLLVEDVVDDAME